MSTTRLARAQALPSGQKAGEVGERSRALLSLPGAIGVALLAVILYAAFAHGGASRSTATRIELAVSVLACAAAFGWIWLGTLRIAAPRLAMAGLLLLAGFAFWSGVSVFWSIAPDQTWLEINRVITYALVVGLGIGVVASLSRGVELIAGGFTVVAAIVTLYALGQKLFPGLHLAGVFTLNQTGPLPRLQAPLGYWNALALFITMGTPCALALAADLTRSARTRLAAACSLQLMLIVIPLTYSRGGLIALALALAAAVALSAEVTLALAWLAAAVLTALPPMLVGLLVHQLNSPGLSLGTREAAGELLALLVTGCLVALVFGGRRLIGLDDRLKSLAGRLPHARRFVLGVVVALVASAVLALSLSPKGLTGTVSGLWQGFTTTHVTSNYNPSRLLSAASENRWVWWKEAAAAFSARPAQGWGAGSFPVLHLIYRRDTLPVQQPHSLPLQFLAETGAVGAVLGIGALFLLVVAGVRCVRRRPSGPERLLTAALVGASTAYAIHCLYDWDWNILALSLPALLFLGAAVAGGAPAGPAQPGRRTNGIRAVWLGAATLWLSALALSVELPQLAADKADDALLAASSGSAARVHAAQAAGLEVGAMDPLTDAGLLVEASAALHRREPQQARAYLQQAVAREPSDAEAWRLLSLVDHGLMDGSGARLAGQRTLQLNPLGRYGAAVVATQLRTAPPNTSATRYPTPAPGR